MVDYQMVPRCSMVLEYLPTFARTKSPSFVGKYSSTMEHMGYVVFFVAIFGGLTPRHRRLTLQNEGPRGPEDRLESLYRDRYLGARTSEPQRSLSDS